MSAPNAVAGIKGFVKLPLAERFWRKVAKGEADDCWPWLGVTKQSDRPYGMIWANGRHRQATQVSWELARGKPFPAGMMACHTCDNPICVNPAHIWPGTMSQNIKDAVAKGRHVATGNGLKTHCKRGHEFTPENTGIRPSTGHRECRTCKAMHNAARFTHETGVKP